MQFNKGRNACIYYENGLPRITKDGVTVIKNLRSSINYVNLSLDLFKHIAHNTNKYCGDNTTTSTIIGTQIFLEGLKYMEAGGNPILIKKGVEKCKNFVIDFLNQSSIKVDSIQDQKLLYKIAQVSTNYNLEISQILNEFFQKLGPNGTYILEENHRPFNEVQFTEGGSLLRGFASKAFLKKQTDTEIEKKNPYILTLNYPVKNLSYIYGAMEYCKKNEKPLVIFCMEMQDDCISQLAYNNSKNIYDVLVIELPMQQMTMNKELMEDLSALFNSKFIDEITQRLHPQFEPSHLGIAQSIKSDYLETTYISIPQKTKQHKERIKQQIQDIEYQMLKKKHSQNLNQLLQNRLQYLNGNYAVMKVGGRNKVERNNNHDILIDGLNSVRNAMLYGLIPGAGVSLLYASTLLDNLIFENQDEKIGAKIFQEALKKPFQSILENANFEPKIYQQKLIENGIDFDKTFDVRTGKIQNFIESGVIDSCYNISNSLHDSVSIGTYLLTVECMITLKEVHVPEPLKNFKNITFNQIKIKFPKINQSSEHKERKN